MGSVALLTLLAFIATLSSTAAVPTLARLGLVPGQPIYTGLGVGPLHLFKSSATNAAIVQDGLRNHPIARSLALAYGDEFPALRDDMIRRLQESEGTGTSGRAGTFSGVLNNPFLRSAISPKNWRFDGNNARKEIEDPYVRHGFLSSFRRGNNDGSSGGGGGGGGGFFRSIMSMFRGGSRGGDGSSSGDGASFRITADSATRAPTSAKARNEVESDLIVNDVDTVLDPSTGSSTTTETVKGKQQ